MKNFTIVVVLAFSCLFSQESLGGQPYSFTLDMNDNVGLIETDIVDHEAMLAEDDQRPPHTPYRYGKKFEENYDFFTHATKEIVDDGNELWRLDIRSRGALAMSLEFSPFYLSDDAYLYMYDDDYSVILGAYSSLNNNEDDIFSIPLLRGELIHIELLIPEDTQEANSIVISEIIHDYRDILNLWENYESERNCGDNVNCSSADDFQDPVNATAFLDMGGYICSGSMINNTNNDLTPYFLTAWHCIDGENPNTWGQKLNQSVIDLIDDSIAGYVTVSSNSADITLTTGNGSTDESRNSMIQVNGALSQNIDVIIPGQEKSYIGFNNTSGSYTVTFKTAAGSGIDLPQGGTGVLVSDGVSVFGVDGTGLGAKNLFAVSGTDVGVDFLTAGTTAATRDTIGMDSTYVSAGAIQTSAVDDTHIITVGEKAMANAIGQRVVSTTGPTSATDPGSLSNLYTGDLWYKTTAFS